MKVKVLKDCSYSADGFTIIKLAKDDIVELPQDIEDKFLDRGLVRGPKKPEVTMSDGSQKVYLDLEEPEVFSPVEETAVIEPVKEVKKRRRKKKAE